MSTTSQAPICGPDAPGVATGTRNPLNGSEAYSGDAQGQVRAERPTADLSHQGGYTATPPQTCLNGCQAGTGPERGPVLCEPGALLCSGEHSCTEKLGKWLRGIPDLFALLPSVVAHGTVPSDPGTKHTKRPDPPAPMRAEVTDLLDMRPGLQYDDDGTPIVSDNHRGVLGIVHNWAELIRDQRHTSRPATATVTSECSLIITNLAWCCGQEWAGDLYDEMKELARTLTDTVGDYRAKPVGKCAALHDRPGVPLPVLCGGALVMDREGTGVHCLSCGQRHEANEGLREMGLIVGRMFGQNDKQLGEAS